MVRKKRGIGRWNNRLTQGSSRREGAGHLQTWSRWGGICGCARRRAIVVGQEQVKFNSEAVVQEERKRIINTPVINVLQRVSRS